MTKILESRDLLNRVSSVGSKRDSLDEALVDVRTMALVEIAEALYTMAEIMVESRRRPAA